MSKTLETLDFTAEEREIIREALKAEEFRETAWEKYGPDWTQYVPQAINIFCWYYFGTALFPYHLAQYYCPTPESTIIGGRGSGKTFGLAIAEAAYIALHPGEDLLHVSITKDQAKKAFDSVVQAGAPRGDHPRFVERFIDHTVSMPFPDIYLRSWGPGDTGNILRYRGVGDESIERLRSYEAGLLTCDEFFRDIPTEDTARQLRGCLRGVNRFQLAQLPKQEQDEFLWRMNAIAMEPDPIKRELLQATSEEFERQHHLSKRGHMSLYGNSGPHPWVWSRYDRARYDPQYYWSFTATSYDNPFFGERDRKALERSFGDDDELREVEMMARRPRSLGSVFNQNQIKRSTNKKLLAQIQRAVHEGVAGYDVENHPEFGIFHYEMPKIKGHSYLIGADPGAGLAPLRNKWVILVFDISVVPVRLVAFQMGYIHRRQQGDYLGFIDRLKYYISKYPAGQGDVWVESTGPQVGMVQVVWPEGLTVTPVTLTTQKNTYIQFAQELMGHGYLEWPEIEQILVEVGNYDQPDKELVQDCVMALIVACGGIWRYYGNAWETDDPEQAAQAVKVATIDRNYRPQTNRNLRSGRTR